jgi:hypothetical protein
VLKVEAFPKPKIWSFLGCLASVRQRGNAKRKVDVSAEGAPRGPRQCGAFLEHKNDSGRPGNGPGNLVGRGGSRGIGGNAPKMGSEWSVGEGTGSGGDFGIGFAQGGAKGACCVKRA